MNGRGQLGLGGNLRWIVTLKINRAADPRRRINNQLPTPDLRRSLNIAGDSDLPAHGQYIPPHAAINGFMSGKGGATPSDFDVPVNVHIAAGYHHVAADRSFHQ